MRLNLWSEVYGLIVYYTVGGSTRERVAEMVQIVILTAMETVTETLVVAAATLV